MAFDLYVGSLTRYYRHDWETVAQKWAKQQGITHKTVYPKGEPPPPPEVTVIQQAVQNWCTELQQGLARNISSKISWNESQEAPYFTDRPGWEGYCGVLLLAAYAEHPNLSPPVILPGEWAGDIAFQRTTSPNFHSKYSQILNPELWIPVDFGFTFDAGTLSSDKARIGSTFELERQLSHLEAIVKQQPAKRQHEASTDSNQRESLQNAGQFGLNIFLNLARHACENKLPMLLDF